MVDDGVRRAAAHLERLPQARARIGFRRDHVRARGQLQGKADPVVLIADVEVAVDHGDAVDGHGHADLLVVERLVADEEDQVGLSSVNDSDGRVRGGCVGMGRRRPALRIGAVGERQQRDVKGDEACEHKGGTSRSHRRFRLQLIEQVLD